MTIGSTYNSRDQVLQAMGCECYEQYLASELWARLRKTAMQKANNRCEVCSSRAVNVHHLTYSPETMLRGGKGLLALCRSCHKCVEFLENGTKGSLRDANQRLLVMAEELKGLDKAGELRIRMRRCSAPL